jgi:hypothetical protein
MIHDHLLICERFKVLTAATGGVVLKLKVSGLSDTQPRIDGKGRGHTQGSLLSARPDSFTFQNAAHEITGLAVQMPQPHRARELSEV